MPRPAALALVLALVAAASLAFAAGAAAAPKVTLKPTSSPPGRLVTVTGRGFCAAPGCSRVSIEITGVPVATGIGVSRNGSFRRRVKVPGITSPGPVGVVVTQLRADGTRSTVIARLQIQLRLAPVKTTETETKSTEIATEPRPTGSEPDEETSSPTTTGDEPEVLEATGTDLGGEEQGGEATPVAAAADDDGRSWPWIAVPAVAVLVAAAGAAVALRALRR